MADSGVSSVSNSYQSQTDKLVAAYKQSRQSEVSALDSKKSSLLKNKNFFKGLYSKINNLSSAIDNFTADNSSDKFITRKVSNSNPDVISVSATNKAILGLNTVFVKHLASNDILVSDRFNLSADGKGFISVVGQNDGINQPLTKNEYTFNISVGSNNPVPITVNLTGDESNEATLKKIVNAINKTADIGVNASLIKDTETTARLSLVSTETGSNNNIKFSESQKGILDALGFNNSLFKSGSKRQVFDDSHAGYKTSDYNELNSKFQLNGIPITRGSNIIDDVVPGITLTLLKSQASNDQRIVLKTNIDQKQVEDLINPLLKEYNNTLNYLKQDKNLLRSDTSVSGLFSSLRGIISEDIPKSNPDDFSYLTEIGISINSDGTLHLGDTNKLQQLLEADPQKVAHLFTSNLGFAKKLSNAIASMTGNKGLIEARTSSLSDQIDQTEKRKEDLLARIDTQANSLRKEYSSMLKVYLEAQNQLNFLSTMPTSNSSSSNLLFSAYK